MARGGPAGRPQRDRAAPAQLRLARLACGLEPAPAAGLRTRGSRTGGEDRTAGSHPRLAAAARSLPRLCNPVRTEPGAARGQGGGAAQAPVSQPCDIAELRIRRRCDRLRGTGGFVAAGRDSGNRHPDRSRGAPTPQRAAAKHGAHDVVANPARGPGAPALDRLADLLAERIAVRLSGLTPGRVEPLVDAAEIARLHGRTRSWVYEHAGELGAVRLGSGPRPRLGCSPARVAAALEKVAEPAPMKLPQISKPGRGRRPRADRTPSGAALLRVGGSAIR